MSRTRVLALTLLAMTAFAGNSLLCRLALKDTSIDAASFTSIRIIWRPRSYDEATQYARPSIRSALPKAMWASN